MLLLLFQHWTRSRSGRIQGQSGVFIALAFVIVFFFFSFALVKIKKFLSKCTSVDNKRDSSLCAVIFRRFSM